MKKVFFDLETTGVMHWKNGIHQIAGLIEIDGKVVEEFDLKIQPNPAALIEKEALDVAGITQQDLATYMPFKQGYLTFTELLSKYCNKFDKKDKYFLYGYNNAPFDNQFLRAFFVQNGDQYFGSWFWANSVDVMVLAAEHLLAQRAEMENFKLHTVAKQFGIEVEDEKLHDGMYDIYLTKKIYETISNK